MNALAMIIAATLAGQGTPIRSAVVDQPTLVQPPAGGSLESAHTAAEQYLRHLYAVYFAIRACTDASLQWGKPEYLPTVSLNDARRTMRVVDSAAKEAGLDVDRIWLDVAPLGLITAEALENERSDQAEKCKEIGGVFRLDLGNLQNVLTRLGSRRPLIEKDF